MTTSDQDVTVTNLIMGPAVLYIADFGATEPAASAIASPPASADWTALGGTLEGVMLRQETEFEDLTVDQIAWKPDTRVTDVSCQVETQLAEVTLANLNYVIGGGGEFTENESAASTAAPAVDSLTPAIDILGVPRKYAVLVDGYAPEGFRRRFILRRCTPNASPELTYSKNGQSAYPVTFEGFYVDSATAPWKCWDQTSLPTSP